VMDGAQRIGRRAVNGSCLAISLAIWDAPIALRP
jgi:hypothetical protein